MRQAISYISELIVVVVSFGVVTDGFSGGFIGVIFLVVIVVETLFGIVVVVSTPLQKQLGL